MALAAAEPLLWCQEEKNNKATKRQREKSLPDSRTVMHPGLSSVL